MKRCFVILSCLFLCSWSVEAAGHGHVTSQHSDEDISGSESVGDLSMSNGQSGPGAVSVVPEVVEQVPQYPSRSQRMAMRMRGIPVPARPFDCRRDCTHSNCKKVDVQHQCRQQCSQMPNIDRCFQANYKADFKRETGVRLSAQVIKAARLKHLDFLKGIGRAHPMFEDRYLQGALQRAGQPLGLHHVPGHGGGPSVVPPADLAVIQTQIIPHYRHTCANLGREFKEQSIFPGRRANRLQQAPARMQTFQDNASDMEWMVTPLPEHPTMTQASDHITALENHLQQFCFAAGEQLPTTPRPSILGRR